MPKIVDRKRQREEIREAAWRVFAARGVKGTGLEHVAQSLGIGRSSIYHYYPDKESLVRDLTADLLREEEVAFETALRAVGSPMQRIEGLVDGLTAVFGEWLAVGPMFFDLRHLDSLNFRRFYRKTRKMLAELIEEGQRLGEIDRHLDSHTTAAALIGLIDGLLLQYLIDRAAFPSIEKLRAQTRRIVLGALKT